MYDTVAPDGIASGSPHVHLVSTEAYVVLGGEGELHTLSFDGFHTVALRPGAIAWFTPGVIHRAVNHGDLRLLVVMSNAGLPEAGDAALTFPRDIVADPDAYARAASLDGNPKGPGEAAMTRRDLAVRGFEVLRKAAEQGDFTPLEEFFEAASLRVRPRLDHWRDVVTQGPLALASRSMSDIECLAAGALQPRGTQSHRPGPRDEPRYGMCGMLHAYDL